MQVPKLRFKEFTSKWKLKKLNDISTCFEYGMNLPSKKYDGYNQYIRITDIDEETRSYISSFSVSPDGKLEDKFIVNKNDILFSRTGASVGKTYLYKEKDGRLYFAGFLIRVHIDEKYNSYFVFSQTLINRYFQWVKLTSMRTGQPGINSQEYAQYKIYLPSVEEQTKIANLLSLIDKKIELQQKLVENFNLYKKGLLQKVFSNNNEWKTAKIGDFLVEYSEKTTINNQYEIISSTSSGLYLQKDYFDKQIASKNNIGYKILRLNQIVFSPQNLWLGNINYNDKFKIGMVSPSYKIYSINNNYNSKFISYLMTTSKAMYEYKLVSEQGASIVRRNLDLERFLNIVFKIPNIEEQNKIAKLFSSIDDKISYETKKLKNLKIYKKGLLQKMFI